MGFDWNGTLYTFSNIFYVSSWKRREAPQTPTNTTKRQQNTGRHYETLERKACKRGKMGFDWNGILHSFPTFSVYLVGKGENTNKNYKNTRNTAKHQQTLRGARNIGCAIALQNTRIFSKFQKSSSSKAKTQGFSKFQSPGVPKQSLFSILACGNANSSKRRKWKDENKSNLERKHCP